MHRHCPSLSAPALDILRTMRLHNLSKNSLKLRSIWTIVQSLEPQASPANSCCTVDCLKRGRILCIRTIPRCAILPVANSGGSLNHDCTWVGHALLSQSPHDRVFALCAVCSPHKSLVVVSHDNACDNLHHHHHQHHLLQPSSAQTVTVCGEARPIFVVWDTNDTFCPDERDRT